MKRENLVLVILLAVLLFGLSIAGWLLPKSEYSDSERRYLAKFPEPTADALNKGSFMSDFETYSLDQFPLRDTFRALKAAVVRGVFLQKDDHGIYLAEGQLAKQEYPMRPVMLEHAAAVFSGIYSKAIEGTDCRVYLAVIPDKNKFLAPSNGYLSMDYDALASTLAAKMPYATPIDVSDLLSADDYYRTDTHWRQEKITDVADRLAEAMGVTLTDTDYTAHTLDNGFNGVYVGQYALPISPDTLVWLTSDTLDACKVSRYNDSGIRTDGVLYDLEKAVGKDPYEMFLMGTQPLIEIENPNAETDRELVLFRDSFGSSLAPLLVSGYAKITIVDVRYLQSDYVPYFVDFSNADVLFMYSAIVLNDSMSLQ